MKKLYFLDANVFLRFLTGDDEQIAEDCRILIQRAVRGKIRLMTHPLILAEVVWVLESYYKLPRREIAEKLQLILNTPGLKVTEEDAFAQAVELYAGHRIDFADCFAAAITQLEGAHLVSYDRDYDKIANLKRVAPGEVKF